MFASGNSFIGLSTDTKPVSPNAAWTFLEMDTGSLYIVMNSAWVKQGIDTNIIIIDTVILANYSMIIIRTIQISLGKKLITKLGAKMRIL